LIGRVDTPGQLLGWQSGQDAGPRGPRNAKNKPGKIFLKFVSAVGRKEKVGRGDRTGDSVRPLSGDWCRRNAEARQQ